MRRALALDTCGLVACAAGRPSPRPLADPGPATVRVLSQGIDGRTWLAPDARRTAAAGALALDVLGASVVSEGDRLGAFVEIPDADCLLAMARASPTVADVDLFAYDDDGSIFSSDESPEPQASLLVCPPHPRRLYVVGRVMSGSGILSIGVQQVPRPAADAVARAAGARGRSGDDTGRFDSWPGLEAKIRAHRVELGARWEDVRRLAMPVGPRAATRVSTSLEPGRCVDVLVVPSDEVGALEVVAEDESARVFARARESGRDRSVLLCAALPAEVSISIRSRGSQGLVAVTIGRTAAGAEPELAASARPAHVSQTLELDAARLALGRLLGEGARSGVALGRAAAGFEPPKAIAAGTARVGIRASFPVVLPAGCTRLDAVAGKPLADLTATLWDDRGALLAEGRGGALASLFPCGKGGSAHLDLEAAGSSGPFAVELRKDRAAPALLVGHPVAAARLLARLDAAGSLQGAEAAAAVQLVSLDTASLTALPLSVAAGTCLEATVALDAEGAGIDLRLVDEPTREGFVTRGRYLASDRLCAEAAERRGTLELRLLAGRGEALVLLRPSAAR